MKFGIKDVLSVKVIDPRNGEVVAEWKPLSTDKVFDNSKKVIGGNGKANLPLRKHERE